MGYSSQYGQPTIAANMPESYMLAYQHPYYQPRAITSKPHRSYDGDEGGSEAGHRWTSYSET